MATKIASRKAKGRALQYKIATEIGKLFNIEFNSQDDQCPIKSRTMGNSGADVYITDKEIDKKFNYAIECKSQEKPSIKSWINQARSNIKGKKNWLLFWKCKDWQKPVVILDSKVFFKLLEKIYKD